ncbi:MAG: hypothetical protein V1253_08680, partial [Alphaproteobacteria bacterium]|nr:hypothetical protein [Alphaproteobacteria bacterium]
GLSAGTGEAVPADESFCAMAATKGNTTAKKRAAQTPIGPFPLMVSLVIFRTIPHTIFGLPVIGAPFAGVLVCAAAGSLASYFTPDRA